MYIGKHPLNGRVSGWERILVYVCDVAYMANTKKGHEQLETLRKLVPEKFNITEEDIEKWGHLTEWRRRVTWNVATDGAPLHSTLER